MTTYVHNVCIFPFFEFCGIFYMMEEKKIVNKTKIVEIIVMLKKREEKKELQTSTRHRNCGMMKDHPTGTL